ncbi:hypothetical protein pipiens_012162 [Culex pipiens pipiens]|uniref:DNA repair protein xp-c / rad4 n=1 Tax=Culex pipiens pipiens TaxID=38569 RepID=A0ABD1D3I6_CULPP
MDPVDSDGSSSVGDHLVSLEDIDLDAQFFSQEFRSENVESIEERARPEVLSSGSDGEGDAEERGRICEMLTQLAQFNSDAAREVVERNREVVGSVDVGMDEEDILRSIHKVEGIETVEQKEGSDGEWELIKALNVEEEKRKDVEVTITQRKTEPPTQRYTDVALTTSEILKRKPEFAHFSQVPQLDGADDAPVEPKRPRLWKLKQSAPARVSVSSGKPKRGTTSKFFNKSKAKQTKKPVTDQQPSLSLWIEVYLTAEKCWTPVDILSNQVGLEHVMKRLPDPAVYVFGWSNDGTLQDVSGRYWWKSEMAARHQRVTEKWLRPVLHRFDRRRKVMRDLVDQLQFRQLRTRAPIPEKLSEFKNHPSYCLKRDLLKFQAIYPPDAPPLGFFHGGEPIYGRECVHTLHSREVWLRHAKTIRLRESPYKVVTSKLRREPTQLELFGHWQTEEYVPPEPRDGKVPRNAYGNIEIFKECMLPRGAVHLKQPNISRICRRLNVDYAPAVVGFGVHAGGNHPVFEGIVICREFEQRVLDEYERDLVEQEQRKREKRERRIYDNWRKLIKGLLIRSRLRAKYNFDRL